MAVFQRNQTLPIFSPSVTFLAPQSLIACDGMPPLDEVTRWNAGSATADDEDGGQGGALGELNKLLAAMPGAAPKATYVKGDKVVAVRGDLAGMNGVVAEIRPDGNIMVQPAMAGFTELVDFEADELTKFFEVGQRVRILKGPSEGASGLVVAIGDDELCTVIADATKEEIKVFKRWVLVQ